MRHLLHCLFVLSIFLEDLDTSNDLSIGCVFISVTYGIVGVDSMDFSF